MKVFRTILIVLMFCCIFVGFVMVLGTKLFLGKKNQDNSRKELKIKLVGYVLFLCAVALAIFQSLIKV